MSRMKHLLRKLHIGTCPSDQHRLSDPVPNQSHPSVSSPDQSITVPDNLGFFEEEFQVQLALAISASDPGSTLEDAESAQIKAAQRISLIPISHTTPLQSSSLHYWNYNFINYDEKVADGFYDVYGNTTNLVSQGKMPALVDLQAISISDDVGYEAILVDRSTDFLLHELENGASCLLLESRNPMQDPILSGLVQKIADLVVCRMGGPVGDADEMLKRWTLRSYELQNYLNTIVLPLGCLDVGLSRHRALLFKVLADRINISCMLVKGSYYTGTDEGAVNLIRAENGSEFIIDLMGAPGVLIPAEVPSGQIQNSRSDIKSSTGVMELVSSDYVGSSNLQYAGIHLKESDENIAKKNRTERFEHDFGKLLPSLHMSCESTSSTCDKASLAQQMQVKDVSKYVISAAKNPEFAQKLHAVLLESGASPPPNLFMNIDSQNLGEDSVPEQIQYTGVMMDNGISNCLNNSVLSDDQLSGLPGITDEGCVYVGCNAKKMTEADSTVGGQHFHENVGISQVLGEVAEWEIPWDDLQIGERIGIGSCGEVYRADWNGTEVAVKKFLDQDFFGEALTQFKYEVELMIRLRHPNVVLFMGAVTRSPNSSILTEFLPRGSLYRLLHRTHTQLDEKRRMRMALDVAKGMNYLHTGHPPIVHRDLKSPNLLVDKNWGVKVCDFGLSRLKHHTYLSSKSTAGTAEWMAPEVLRNEPSNEKCDVFSFGVILWELATLHVPWSGMNPMQVVGAVGFQNRRLEIPEDVDLVVGQIILDCWQVEPHLRPSFSQLIFRLRRLQRLVVKERPQTNTTKNEADV